jgi:cell division FtsZ-interacting protein ZapD
MEKELYVLYACDEWKSSDSMGLLGVFDENKIKDALKKMLKQKDIELETSKSIDEIETERLNAYVKYAHIEQIDLNDMHNV